MPFRALGLEDEHRVRVGGPLHDEGPGSGRADLLVRVQDEDDPAESRARGPEGFDREDPGHQSALHVADPGAEDAVPVQFQRPGGGRPIGEDGVGMADQHGGGRRSAVLFRDDEVTERPVRSLDRVPVDGPAVGVQPLGAAFDDPVHALD